jgi:hypothetical protein
MGDYALFVMGGDHNHEKMIFLRGFPMFPRQKEKEIEQELRQKGNRHEKNGDSVDPVEHNPKSVGEIHKSLGLIVDLFLSCQKEKGFYRGFTL